MPARPYYKRSGNARNRDATDAIVSGVARLLSLGNYDRNELAIEELDRLRDLVDIHGRTVAAEKVGVSPLTLMSACAGFAHRLQPETAARVRKFVGRK